MTQDVPDCACSDYRSAEAAGCGDPVPTAATRLTRRDRWDAVKLRLGIARDRSRVEPGLYAVGAPTADAPVFVSANYKLSFDHLRRALAGIDGWLLVLDTQGVNVWCAAGKGTFGTEELAGRIEAVGLARRVRHRQVIVPQLGAPGVAAHAVRERTGFRVVYGPVRAADIPAFLRLGLRAEPAMRRVRFGLADRLVLVPVELVSWCGVLALFALALGLLGGLHGGSFDAARLAAGAGRTVALSLAAYAAGLVLTPVLLPWLPGRAFALKGACAGGGVWALLWAGGAFGAGRLEAWAWLVLTATAASFLGMQFTGCSTFTSESGVRREMRVAVPLQIAGLLAGLGLYVASRLAR